MVKLIYFDIFYLELWFPYVVKRVFGIDLNKGVKKDDSVNKQFEEFGFESK
jgi:hypothetical protein